MINALVTVRLVVLFFFLSLSVFTSVTHAQSPPAHPVARPTAPAPLRLVVSTEVMGRIASLSCGARSPTPTFHRVAAALDGERDAVALDTGDLLGAAAISRLAIATSPDAFARAIVSTGLRALSIGRRDLATPRATLIRAAGALRGWGIHYILSNLRCAPSAASLCEVIVAHEDPPIVLHTPFGRLGVVSALSPTLLGSLARERRAGLSLTPAAEALDRAVRAARARGAERVIAVFQPGSSHPLEETLTLSDALHDDGRPDVLLVNDVDTSLDTAVSRTGVRLAATRESQARVITLDTTLHTSAPLSGYVPLAVLEASTSLNRHLCATENQALAGGGLNTAMSSTTFAELLLDVLRERSGAEIALLQRSVVQAREIFPLSTAITDLDLDAALPTDEVIVTGTLHGSELRSLNTSHSADLYLRGLEDLGHDHLKINGRDLDNDTHYTVVTTRFALDQIPSLSRFASRFTELGSAPPRELLRSWLQHPRVGDITLAPIDPARRTRWAFRTNLDVSLGLTAIHNPTALTDAQLARTDSLALRGDLELRADADHPAWALENGLRFRYGQTRTVDSTGASTGFVETLDLITLRDVFVLRSLQYGPPRWYVPLPYSELYVESEFTPPDGPTPTRNYRHLQLRPTAGARFQLRDTLSLFAGMGFDWETLQPSSTPAFVFIFGYQLLTTRLFSLGDRAVEAQGSLDVSWRDPGGNSDALVRLSARLSIPVFEPLSITLSYDLFGRTLDGGPFNSASDFTVGLRVGYLRTLQSYRY